MAAAEGRAAALKGDSVFHGFFLSWTEEQLLDDFARIPHLHHRQAQGFSQKFLSQMGSEFFQPGDAWRETGMWFSHPFSELQH